MWKKNHLRTKLWLILYFFYKEHIFSLHSRRNIDFPGRVFLLFLYLKGKLLLLLLLVSINQMYVGFGRRDEMMENCAWLQFKCCCLQSYVEIKRYNDCSRGICYYSLSLFLWWYLQFKRVAYVYYWSLCVCWYNDKTYDVY